jgi:hypothetical protein
MSTAGWLQRWFNPGRNNAESGKAGALKELKQQSRINYSATLVPDLKTDHQDLLKIYGEVGTLLQNGRYAAIQEGLRAFKSRLDVHLLNENLRFYCYLEQRLADAPNELQIIKEFRQDMNGIARVVVGFLRKYQAAGVHAQNKDDFLSDYRQIGTALAERIEREERGLYALYVP